MSNQYPGTTPGNTPDGTPNHPRGKNRTAIMLISILVVLLLIAAVTIGWLFANQDSDDTESTTAVATSPVETITDSSPVPGTVTVTDINTATNTVSVEPTTATVIPEPTIPTVTTTTGQVSLPADACEPATFQEAGHDFVDLVMFCDSGWARAGTFQTDNVRPFRWVDGAWEIYPPAGESAISGYPCYDSQAMADEGAPWVLLMETLDCEFAS